MSPILAGILLIAAGGFLIAFHKPFVEISVGYQIWAFRMPYGKRAIQLSYAVAILIGSVLIISGALVLLGIAK